jgi:hypothetical protein
MPADAADLSSSPRAGSPWDGLLKSPSLLASSFPETKLLADTDASRECSGSPLPKLEPESEEGNVEYKLKRA